VEDVIGEEFYDAGEALLDCIKNQVKGNMESIVIPNDVHKNKSDKTAPNRKKVKEAREKFKQEHGRDPTLEETSEMEADVVEEEVDDNMPDGECKDLIKNGLDFFRDLEDDYFDKLFDVAEELCKNKGLT